MLPSIVTRRNRTKVRPPLGSHAASESRKPKIGSPAFLLSGYKASLARASALRDVFRLQNGTAKATANGNAALHSVFSACWSPPFASLAYSSHCLGVRRSLAGSAVRPLRNDLAASSPSSVGATCGVLAVSTLPCQRGSAHARSWAERDWAISASACSCSRLLPREFLGQYLLHRPAAGFIHLRVKEVLLKMLVRNGAGSTRRHLRLCN